MKISTILDEYKNHPDFVKAFAKHGNNIQDDQAITTNVDGISLLFK